ncbi:MAG TPA: 2-C-methyl-D-erythritol 4-phosphate cytidylyltransferase [bacterium]|nr:2-C-methyl-D-erythritol 4-phosphate cytidylyltransferase [bacterium]
MTPEPLTPLGFRASAPEPLTEPALNPSEARGSGFGFRAIAIVVAAGSGTRMAAAARKAFIPLAGAPMVLHTVRAVSRADTIDGIVVVVGEQDVGAAQSLFPRSLFPKVSAVIAGGPERQDSVYAGLLHAKGADLIVIHDGARPLVSHSILDAVVRAAAESGAASAGVPVRETVKEVTGQVAQGTVDRDRLWVAHTPQAFRSKLLRDAHEQARATGFRASDDAALIERQGQTVRMIEDSPANFKITVPDDLALADVLVQGLAPPQIRHGIGIDAHRLVMGRPLVLGGVRVPFQLGLQGHSDADALAHAVMDALLGAAGLGDIGQHFPQDAKYKDADSVGLLRVVVGKVRGAGWRVINVDAVVLAEAPRLAPYLEAMRGRLAEALELDPSGVNVKATTMEGMGAVGRGEGIVVHAVATLAKT